jgi:hypothetical protein
MIVAAEVLKKYTHPNSPRKYTQHQLFACLVLKTFLKTDYRGLTAHLADHSDLRNALGLHTVPHFTTPQKASRRILALPVARRLFRAVVRQFLGRKRRLRRVAFDATGIELGHASQYYVRRAEKTVLYSRYAKLEAAFDCDSHLMLAAIPGRGPKPDANRFVPLLNETQHVVRPKAVLADAGYDSEANHVHARGHNVRAFIPATIGRPSAKLPAGKNRRRMRQRLDKNDGRYGQRWQAEAGFSMLKRRLATCVRGHGYWSQCRDLMLLAITFNIMLC